MVPTEDSDDEIKWKSYSTNIHKKNNYNFLDDELYRGKIT